MMCQLRCVGVGAAGISTAHRAARPPGFYRGTSAARVIVIARRAFPRVLFRSSGGETPHRPPMKSCGFRRARPRARALVVPNQPKHRFSVKIVRFPLLLTKLSYGAPPVVVPVGVMQKTGL